MNRMKLYRGLKSSEYKKFDPQIEEEIKNSWRKILELRAKGEYSYPEVLNEMILKSKKISNLKDQHFTDNQEIAYQYAKKEGGMVIEIQVGVDDILNYFMIEFQNFTKRRELFELVYVVSSKDLLENSSRWNLREIKINEL